MAKKMKTSGKEGVKRLQEGPRRARQPVAQRMMTGKMLRKLVDKLSKEIPEMKMGEEVRRMQRMEIRSMTPSQRRTAASPKEEECLAMLGWMTIYRKETPGKKVRSVPVETEMDRLKLVEE